MFFLPYHRIPHFQDLLFLILYQKHPQALQTRYKLEKLPEQPEAIFEAIGRRRGLLASGNSVRVEDAAFLLLQEFRTGKLGAFTLDEPNEWGFSC